MQLHAEKKALAVQLTSGEAELSVSINFNACMDCHEFFKFSSELLGRRIVLHQPKMSHDFIDGRCSCNDRWRWEAKLTSLKHGIAGATEKEQELDAREGNHERKAAKRAAAEFDALDKNCRRVTKLMAAAVMQDRPAMDMLSDQDQENYVRL